MPLYRESDCYTDYALQEYMMNKLDSIVRKELRDHLQECKECASCYNQYLLEKNTIQNILSHTGSITPGSLCIDDETLARFLDRALDEDRTARCETHLAVCTDCYDELLHLYNLQNEAHSFGADSKAKKNELHPKALILKMPKRKPALNPNELEIPD